MDAQRYANIREAFIRIVEAPASQRLDLFARLREQDQELRLEVERLLGACAGDRDTEGAGTAGDGIDAEIQRIISDAAGDFLGEGDGSRRAKAALASALSEVATRRTPAGRAPPVPGSLPTSPPVDVPNHLLLRCIGAGGFGQVWLARHVLTEHYRACKLIPADRAAELEGLRRLRQKVPGHPNLFPVEEVGAADKWLYCLMPLADNAASNHAVLDDSGYEPLTLEVYLKRQGRRPTCEASAIGLALADAVRHLHEHGVTHGDIKPSNIMRLNGQWTLADYGLAQDLSRSSGHGYTPGYTPPEGPGSRSADLYALGVVLMELMTTWAPSMLQDFRETERGPSNGETGLADIILRATESEPTHRLGSAGELIEALRSLAADPDRADGSTRGRGGWWIGIGIALAVLFTAVWLALPKNPGQRTQMPPTTTPSPIAIESFEVRHYRYDAATDSTVAIGPISADNPAAQEGDDVTLHARLSGEGYAYLLSLDADGRVRPRIPASPTDLPVKSARIDYPSLPTGTQGDILYNLSRGPGTHGFMLLISDQPLPAWSDWIAAHGEPTWTRESLPADGVMLFDGRETTYATATREPMPRRGRLLLDPIDWAKAQQDLTAAFIAFPVLPSEEN